VTVDTTGCAGMPLEALVAVSITSERQDLVRSLLGLVSH